MTENGAATTGTTGAICCHIICHSCNERFIRPRFTDLRRSENGELILKICVNLRNLWRTLYEENRHSFWSGTQLSAGVCRAGESENRRQRYFRGVGQDRQGDPWGAVWLRRGDRPHLSGRAVLSRLAQECRAHRHGGREQSILVERRRKIFQQRARDQNRRGRSAYRALAVESAAAGHERQIISQPQLSARLGRNFQLRRLAGVLQAVRRRRLEKRISAPQSGRI